MADWDRTAAMMASSFNNALLVRSGMAKTKLKPRSMFDFHPYRRKPQKEGLKINTKNFGMLRTLGALLCKGKE